MGLIVGMDEAGYGPNLGPLVVTATAWEVPEDPREVNFWEAFAEIIDQSPAKDGSRLHVADSKQVYSPSRGIGNLERGLLATLMLSHKEPKSFQELCNFLSENKFRNEMIAEPWFQSSDLSLPYKIDAEQLGSIVPRWRECCQQAGIKVKGIVSDIVLPTRFNRMTRKCDSKGRALSQISMALLRRVWQPNSQEPVLVIADKHGGRNRYDEFLENVVDGEMIFRLEEGTQRSCYRVGNSEIRFQTRAESHFPVAIASMVSKYIRELSMMLFNQFWSQHIPDLKPTKGYPVDAKRFKNDIAEMQVKLNISDDLLWRER